MLLKSFKLILLTLLLSTVNLYAIVGATKGAANVSQGNLEYSLEILTSKGISGLQPKLSVDYSSSNSTNSIFGVGFSLSGLSTITKCKESLFEEKNDPSRTFNYCLDGQKLLLEDTTEVYGAANTSYKTEINSLSKIVKYDTYWKIWTKDGLIYEYGNTADSNDNDTFFKVNSITDRFSNTINFIYESENNNQFIKQITYADNTIDFEYEDRDDKRVIYYEGVKANADKRVNKISLKTAGLELSSYNFSYTYENLQSKLTAITECSQGQCLEPVTFQWEDSGEIGFTELQNWGQNASNDNQYNPSWSSNSNSIDLNGDGLPDRIHNYNYTNSQFGYWVQLNTGDGFTEFQNWGQNATYSQQYSFKRVDESMFIDLNGDGLPDRIHHYNYDVSQHGYWVQLNTGDGFTEFQNWGQNTTSNDQYKPDWNGNKYSSFVDVNGDGLPDRVHHHNYTTDQSGYWVQLNTGSSFGEFQNWGQNAAHNNQYSPNWAEKSRFIDINGDGLVDRIHHYNYTTSQPGHWVQLNTGSGFGEFQDWGQNASDPTQYQDYGGGVHSNFSDVNGDGLVDRVHHYNYTTSQHGYWVQLNTGSGFTELQNWGQNASRTDQYNPSWTQNSRFADVNGDGLPDRVHHQNYTTSQNGYWVQLNTGSGFTELQDWGQNTTNSDQYKDWIGASGENHSSFIDINGDGLIDRIHHKNYTTGEFGYWVQLNKGKQSRIVAISNQKDLEIEVSYSDLRDEEVYTALDDAELPILDIKKSSMDVVKEFRTIDGLGGFNTISFKYEGLKVDKQRGMLGFKKVTTIDETSDTKTIVNNNQTFPFTGMAETTEVYIGNVKISEELNTFSAQNYYTNSKIINIELTQNVKHSYDVDGGLIKTIFTINSGFDKYGNISNIQTTTKRNDTEFSKVTQSVYENDEANWILARLSSSQVTHIDEAGNQKAKLAAFTYYPTGSLKTETIEPNLEKAVTTTYEYDSFGNQISKTVSAVDIEPRVTKYLYDTNGKNLLQVTNTLNQSIVHEYDQYNNLVKTTDANNLVVTYQYDALRRKIAQTNPDGTTITWDHQWDNTVTNGLYSVTKTATGTPPSTTYFNRLNRKIRTVNVGFDGSEVIENTYYNKKSQVQKASTPHYVIDTPKFIEYEYDILGRTTKVTRPTNDSVANIETISYTKDSVITTNAKGQSKTVTKNLLGKIVEVIEPLGTTITYTYDPTGNLLTTTDVKGNVITLTYDAYGNKQSQNDPDMGIWTYTYNSLGEVISQTDAKGQVITMKYDDLGRMIERNEPEGLTQWVYDRSVNGIGKLSYVVTDNYKKELYYDQFSRLKETKEFVEENVFTTSYVYNSEGKLEKTIRPDGFTLVNEFNAQGYLQAVKTPKGGASSYDYETLKAAIQTSLESSLTYAKEAITYKNEANIKRAQANLFIELSNQTTDEDLKAQLLSTASLAGETALLKDTASADADEESLKAIKLVGFFLQEAQSFKDKEFYDYVASKFRDQTRFYIDLAFENLDQAIVSIEKLTTDTSLEAHYVTQEKELLDSYITQTQSIINRAKSHSEKMLNYKNLYNQAVANEELHEHSTYLDMVEDENFIYYYKILQADQFGRVTSDIVGNGLITNKDYDSANGQLKTITTGYNSGDDVRNIKYTYDILDNVAIKEDFVQNLHASYEYDDLNRLTSATITGNSIDENLSYEYDELGNITFKSDIGLYTYDSVKPHQLTQAGDIHYTYDANGNVVAKNDTTITYSSFNKPTQISNSTHTTNFFYGPDRARYKKTTNTSTTYYVGKMFEKEIDNGIVRYKNFIYAGKELIAVNIEEDDGTLLLPSVRYFHRDALDSIDTITNESGVVVQRLNYKPFGNRIVGDWQSEGNDLEALTKRGFTGHEHIKEFNLIHMNGRVYDPETGRFLSADPHIQAPYDTQSYNRYSYVKNNPLKYTDPSGYFFKKIVRAIKKNIKTIITVAVVVAVGVMTGGAGLAMANFLLGTTATSIAALGTTGALIAAATTGAIAGFAGGVVGTLLNGGGIKTALKNGLQGAVVGAVSAGVAYGVAEAVGSHTASFLNATKETIGTAMAKAVLHGISRAAIAKAQNHKTSAAFWTGFVASGFAAPESWGVETGAAISAVVAGTVSEISGGKFANGAVTGAFQHLFNDKFDKLYYQNKISYTLPEDHIISKINSTYRKIRDGLGESLKILATMDGSHLTAKQRAPLQFLKFKYDTSPRQARKNLIDSVEKGFTE